MLCSKEDAAQLAGIQLRIQETTPAHPVTGSLSSTANPFGASAISKAAGTTGIGAGIGSVQADSSSHPNLPSLSPYSTGVILTSGSVSGSGSIGAAIMSAPTGPADRNSALGAKLRPICEDAKVIHVENSKKN